MNNHNELDTVCPRYNEVLGVHDIEPHCEEWHSECVAVLYHHVQTYIVYTKYAALEREPLNRMEDPSCYTTQNN